MTRTGICVMAAAALAMLSACGGGDPGTPTAEENRELDNAAEMLDTSPDSLVVSDEDALGNGDEAQTGDLPVVNDALANGAPADNH